MGIDKDVVDWITARMFTIGSIALTVIILVSCVIGFLLGWYFR